MTKSPASAEIHNVGKIGVVSDIPGHQLPPEAWTASNNIRFQDGNAEKFKGDSQAFGTPTVAPSFVLNVPAQIQSYWLYPSLTKCYVYEGGVHTNITRQTAGVDVNYTADAHRKWNGTIFGGIPLLNNGADVPQYWSSISVGTKLANLPNWPAGVTAKVVRAFGRFLIAFNITEAGTLKPQMFWWSHRADPGTVPTSWDYTNSTIEAGRKELTDVEGGDILDAMLLGNQIIIYKETSTHAVRFVGGQEILGNDLLFATTGILAPRCVAAFRNGSMHFVVTADSFITHSGQTNSVQELFNGEVKKTVFAELDTTNYLNSFVFSNQAENEVWFCYPTSGQTYPNKALVWNWKYNTTQFRDFHGTWAAVGAIQEVSGETWATAAGDWDSDAEQWSTQSRRKVIVADPTAVKFYKLDDGHTFAGTDMLSYLERNGLALIGKDRQGNPKVNMHVRKLVTRIWPKISGTALVTVRLGSQEDRNDAVTWQATGVFDPSTDLFLDLVANGRLLAVRFEATTNLPWKLEGYTLDLTLLGEH